MNSSGRENGLAAEDARLKRQFAGLAKGCDKLREAPELSPLTTKEVLNRSRYADFMHDVLPCGRDFRTFNVVNDFNR